MFYSSLTWIESVVFILDVQILRQLETLHPVQRRLHIHRSLVELEDVLQSFYLVQQRVGNGMTQLRGARLEQLKSLVQIRESGVSFGAAHHGLAYLLKLLSNIRRWVVFLLWA